MAVFLVIGLVFLGLGAFFPKAQGEIAASYERGVFGGPASNPGAPAGFSEDKAMFASQPMPDSTSSSGDSLDASLEENASFQATALRGTSGAGMAVIPGSAKPSAGFGDKTDSLSSKNYFILPTQGFNWGKLHLQNAVDIVNSCGAPVVASAQGLAADFSLDSWGGGYGHYAVIIHPNGTKTRYAHLDKIFVSLGQYVKQGDSIGTVGRTGDATGCHVHFEVEGAANPFARQ